MSSSVSCIPHERPEPPSVTSGRAISTVALRLSTPLARGQLAWFALIVGAWSALLFRLPLDPDYTSGELLDHLASWTETGELYPALGSLPPLRVLNYPPLVLLLARGITEVGVPALMAARIVDAVGLLGLVAGVAWWARARGTRGGALAGTAGLLGASYPVLYGAGQFHIELVAAAGMVWGFALVDRASSWGGAALGGLALALACFAKQAQVVPAVVALAFAWRFRRSLALPTLAAFALAGVAGSVAMTTAFGMEAWRHTLTYTVGTYSLMNLGRQLLTHVAPWSVLLAFVIRSAWVDRQRARADALVWYLAGALVWSLSAARVGSAAPYFLDVHLATAMLAGPLIFGGGRVASRGWMLLLGAQVVLADLGAAVALGVDVSRMQQLVRDLPALCERVAGDAQVLAEEAGVVRACGRAALADPLSSETSAN